MFVAMCCLLFAVAGVCCGCCLLFVICVFGSVGVWSSSLLFVRCLLFVVVCCVFVRLLVARCVVFALFDVVCCCNHVFVMCCLLLVACCWVVCYWCSLFAACCWEFVDGRCLVSVAVCRFLLVFVCKCCDSLFVVCCLLFVCSLLCVVDRCHLLFGV